MLCVDPTSRKVHRAAVRRVSRETRGRRFTAVVSERESVRIGPRKTGLCSVIPEGVHQGNLYGSSETDHNSVPPGPSPPPDRSMSWACSRGVGHLVASARATLAREGLMGGVRARKRAAPAVDAWPESNTVER